ncbi:MAG: hypothetical protein AAF266_07605 [Planctomycetota bacterium]
MLKLTPVLVACSFVLVAHDPAEAVLVRSFTTLNEVNQSPDANEVGGGTVDIWAFDSGGAGPANAGSFIGDSGANAAGSGAGAGNPAWALYANSGATSTASANLAGLMGRSLAQAGDSISLNFDNGFIDNTRSVGVQFVDSNGVVTSQLSFTGGDAEYQLSDVSTTATGVGFTGDGFNIALTLTSGNGEYTIDFAGTTLASRLLSGSVKDIASIEVFNASAGGGSERDIYFNNLTVTAVPEVSAALAMPMLFGLLAGLRRGNARD